MSREPSPEIDDELFNDIYGKAYSGPVASAPNSSAARVDAEKRPLGGNDSEEEDGPRDPNAVPTDFTSREAKVWEAKAKATERNWKKRKEEEMICKICGESGHFTQGCPSTLGANRRSADFFERVPARDKQVRDLFSQKVITRIENDIGCKLRMDEKFLFVSGKDRLILAKGVDAVHKVIQEGKGNSKSSSSPKRARSRSPEARSPKDPQLRRSSSQRSHSPRNPSRAQSRGFPNDRPVDDRTRNDTPKFSKGSPKARAYAKYGAKGHSAQSHSPRRPTDAFRSHGGGSHYPLIHKPDNWSEEKFAHTEQEFELQTYPQTLEDLEMEFKREAIELARTRDQDEDQENYKHREVTRELREDYLKRLGVLRNEHSKQWDEFLQLGIQRQQQAQLTGFSQPRPSYSDYERRSMQFVETGAPIDSRIRYPHPIDEYPNPRPGGGYSEYQRPKHEDFGRSYGRY